MPLWWRRWVSFLTTVGCCWITRTVTKRNVFQGTSEFPCHDCSLMGGKKLRGNPTPVAVSLLQTSSSSNYVFPRGSRSLSFLQLKRRAAVTLQHQRRRERAARAAEEPLDAPSPDDATSNDWESFTPAQRDKLSTCCSKCLLRSDCFLWEYQFSSGKCAFYSGKFGTKGAEENRD
ncbi:unnamed protein product [Vitrella brassicaformis CCMP3155]|uniref:Apple domain-containing protein n=1 Tax=Vitrella brassicaformis (strain CCMP3155) TaxID=1169540 RepID=A0A0G4EF74_VITBC|nr:unnamed protein product [Vitrella brassicaformis CCMP3155]|eukprot:CEL94621.1 unnamed protein product [Vitrella brassicaformis CCMP3155]